MSNPPTMTGDAIISCDFDTVDRHLHGYGINDAESCDRVYTTAMPRLLDLLDEMSIPATFFVIGADASRQRDVLRRAASAGHEIASHSMTHPEPFRVLDDARLRREVGDSRSALADAVGRDVVGFRAPGWDVNRRVLDELAGAGYRYDASVFPSPVLFLNRLAMFMKSTRKSSLFKMDLFGLGRRAPHLLPAGGSQLVEFPVAVSARLRVPVYHTLAYLMPRRLFRRSLDSMLRDPMAFGYQFHAVDLLDQERDRIDPRLRRHPGMAVPLERKLALLREMLGRVAASRRTLTYEAAASSLAAG